MNFKPYNPLMMYQGKIQNISGFDFPGIMSFVNPKGGPKSPSTTSTHSSIPEGGQSVDIRKVCTIIAGTSENLMTITGRTGETMVFTGYGVFTDAANEDDIEFIPRVNGNRVFPLHGDPTKNYKIALGLAPDLSNYSLIKCDLRLLPGDVLTWDVVNNGTQDTDMGVRMIGFVDAAQQVVTPRFGG